MTFELSLPTDPRFIDMLPPELGPGTEDFLGRLRGKLGELGCLECCSGFPLTFIKESADFGGSGTIVGNGLTLEGLTRFEFEKELPTGEIIRDDMVLAEGANGVIINIGRLSPGQTIDPDDVRQSVRAALLVGSKEAMNDFETLESRLRDPQLRERLGAFDAIGFAEFPLVARTNDPLIT